MKNIRFSTCILLAAFVLIGCYGPTHHPDPLAGWKADFTPRPSDQIIEKDYQDYIQNLPPQERRSVGTIHIFEDGTGQHAIKIEIGLNGTWWQHVLIYDKDDKRIKAIKYSTGGYRS